MLAMKNIYTLILFTFLVIGVRAQDPHFSQFFSSPLTLNPAFTGKFDGDVRLTGDYRNQWPSINNAFITSTGAVDAHVAKRNLADNDNWGIGAVFLTDNSANGAVKFNYFTFSTAYHKGLDEDGRNQLSGGAQVTYANMMINTSSLKFEDQLTANGFTKPVSIENFGNNTTLSTNYFDLNAGLLYTGSTSERNSFYVGASVYHINKPTQKLTAASSYSINPRTTIHAGGYTILSPGTTLHYSAIETLQGGANETVLGGTFQFIANPEEESPTSLFVGSWLRVKDAFIPYVGLEYMDTRIGITYDVNTSNLKTASNKQGGIEIAVNYIYRASKDKPIHCPRF